MDKFIVKKVAGKPAYFQNVTIRMSTYELAKRMQEETGMKFVDLIDAALNFCAARLVVEEEE